MTGVQDNQARRQQDAPSKQTTAAALKFLPNEDIQFGYHSIISGKQTRITNDGLRAERINPSVQHGYGVTYGARPLRGRAEFEVKIDSYGAGWLMSILIGVTRCKKGVLVPINHESGASIPLNSDATTNYCIWSGLQLFSNLVTPNRQLTYGSVDLRDLREGDHLGLHLSEDGVLEFTVNGEGQGIAAENVYTRNTDVYAFVDHYGQCVATVITKAG